MEAFDAPSQRRPRAGDAKSYSEQVVIDDSDEDFPTMKSSRPTPRASSSASKPSYQSTSESQSSRGVAFEDSDDDEEDPFKAPRSHTQR